MAPVETNYMIYDKELLAIIRAFETWRLELTSVPLEGLSQDLPKGFDDEREQQQFQTVLQNEHLDEDVQKAICATFAVTTRARVTTVEEAPEEPPEAAPEAALEPAQLVDEYDVPDLFSDTNSEVSEPPATMPDEDIPGDAYRDVTPEATPKPEAEAPEEPLENLITEAYTNDELV
ncbi:hypothetical protein ASPCAL13419 [Aspergillus calidoustus]|uniref:Reverse transcriptase RNase H-like domain-containing protein n=1 Tax=Aspergillus calidoustus TaxID=454130 RepID=A0A0U5CHK9_ASPCI|nr:hypothetical protein ASPCAL13419 [Aspergillus calidoustus]